MMTIVPLSLRHSVMCGHQHHPCPHTLSRVPGVTEYTTQCRAECHSAPCSRKCCEEGRGLRRWPLPSLLRAPLMPIWFGTSEPSEARQLSFDCSLKVYPTSGVAAPGVGVGAGQGLLQTPRVLGAHRQQEKPSAWKLL